MSCVIIKWFGELVFVKTSSWSSLCQHLFKVKLLLTHDSSTIGRFSPLKRRIDFKYSQRLWKIFRRSIKSFRLLPHYFHLNPIRLKIRSKVCSPRGKSILSLTGLEHERSILFNFWHNFFTWILLKTDIVQDAKNIFLHFSTLLGFLWLH